MLDPITISIVLSLALIGCTVSLFLTWKIYSDQAGMTLWFLAFLLMAGGIPLSPISMLLDIPEIGDMTFILSGWGVYCLYLGILRYVGIKRPGWIKIMISNVPLVVGIVMTMIYFPPSDFSDATSPPMFRFYYQVHVFCLHILLWTALASMVCLEHHTEYGRGVIIFGSFSFLLGLAALGRLLVFVAVGPEDKTNLFLATDLYVLVLIAFLISVTISIIQMMKRQASKLIHD